MESAPLPDTRVLIKMVKSKMPFGKYKESYISDLPISYLEWFSRKGFPKGELGIQLNTIYEMKLNGLDQLLSDLKNKFR